MLGDTPKPPAGRPLHPFGEERVGGHPQTPGREDAAPLLGSILVVMICWAPIPQTPGREDAAPLLGSILVVMICWGHPQTPGREYPAPLRSYLFGEERRVGGHPQTPGREHPARDLC